MIREPEFQRCGFPPVVLFTIDTEPDRQWFDHRITTTENIHHLPRLQRLFDELEIVPTYLVTYSVATDPSAAGVLNSLQQISGCEIGSHLHVWDTPPFSGQSWFKDFPAFAHDLPVELVQAKLVRLTQAVGEAFGRPTAYRAGRFGFAAEHIALLEDLGYRVDSSVTPLIDRSCKQGVPFSQGGRGGRDYRLAPLEPYHPDYLNDLRPGSARLLEVPLTVGFTRRADRLIMTLHRHGPELLQRCLRKFGISQVVSASPVHYSELEMQAMFESAIASGRRVFNFTLHSSETMPESSPTIRSDEDLNHLLERIRTMIVWLRERLPFVSCGLSALADADERRVRVSRRPAEKLVHER